MLAIMKSMSDAARRLLHAARFAAEKHAGQKRKGANEEPYVNHVIEVAALIADHVEAVDPDVLVAAFLHDTVEDTDVTNDDVRAQFGVVVAGMVAEVTDDKSLPKETRKALQVANAAHKSPGAALIKLADKISNLRAMLSSPPKDWSLDRRQKYFEWAKQVIDNLPPTNPALKAEFDRIYARSHELAEK